MEISNSANIEKAIRNLKSEGDRQYQEFVKTRLLAPTARRVPLTEKISKNQFHLPSLSKIVDEKWQGISDREEKALLHDLQVIAPLRPQAVKDALR